MTRIDDDNRHLRADNKKHPAFIVNSMRNRPDGAAPEKRETSVFGRFCRDGRDGFRINSLYRTFLRLSFVGLRLPPHSLCFWHSIWRELRLDSTR